MQSERLVKLEGKANFSKRPKQFDGLTWLTPTPIILRQIYATVWTDEKCFSTRLRFLQAPHPTNPAPEGAAAP